MTKNSIELNPPKIYTYQLSTTTNNTSIKHLSKMADEQSAAFFQPMGDSFPSDEPILLGAPAEDITPSGEYIGEIDAAPPAVLIPEPPTEMPLVLEPIALPSGVEEVEEEEDEDAAAEDALEPSPMAKWSNEWQVTLKERKDEENAAKAACVEAAESELQNFQAGREAKRESRMARNRGDEQDKLEAIEADLENDNSWQRVVKMVELNQDAAEGSQDCGRMRDVLIFLKNDADRAAILA
jgi:type IV secretory pathway VirB10-like protein